MGAVIADDGMVSAAYQTRERRIVHRDYLHPIYRRTDLHQLISAKAQVTKVRRKIEEYVAYNRAHNLFFDENTDTDLQKAREKLATKIANVQAAEERMKLKIKQIQEEKQ